MSHTLHIKVVEAKNLKSADANGFSDPYAKITIHDKKEIRTKTIKKTLNPKWDEEFHIEGIPEKGSFVINVWDWDLIGSDDFLGSVKVDYTASAYSRARDKWLPVIDEDGQHGEIHLVMQVTPKGSKADLKSVENTSLSDVRDGSGRLVVEVVKASNLPSKDFNGFSDPFCVLKLGHTEHKTHVLEKTLNPMWYEEFNFEVTSIDSKLTIELFDWDLLTAHDRMGIVVVDLQEISDEYAHVGSFKIVPYKKERVSGELFLRLQYTSPENSQKNFLIAKKEYNRIKSFVLAGDAVIAVNMLQLYESQELARAMVLLFSSEHKIADYFSECFSREVEKTQAENTLFRTDSPATKSAVAYLKLVDSHTNYLRNTLHELINMVGKDPLKYEIDAAKVGKEARKTNLRNLMEISQKFLDVIYASQASMPPQYFELIYVLRSVVHKKFAGIELKAVGAIFFLRFVCPAIFSPEGFDLADTTVSADYRRALTLIAKTLQNIANGVQFGMKEQSMADINPYLIDNQPKINELFDYISKMPKVYEPIKFTDDEKYKSMAQLVKNLRSTFASIQKLTLEDPRMAVDPAKAAEIRLQVDQLSALMSAYM